MREIHKEIPFKYRLSSSILFVGQHFKKISLESMRVKNVEKINKYFSRKDVLGKSIQVDRLDDLTEQDFIKKYLNAGIPVIFNQGAKNWECTKKWSLDYFGKQFSDEDFSIIDSTGLVEDDFDKTKNHQVPVLIEKVKGREFVDNVKKGMKQYLRFCPIMETHPELTNDLDQNWLKKFRRCFLGISYQSFIGPSGRTTPLHSETTAFFYIMADGEKKWTLYSPNAFPLLNPNPAGRGYNFSSFKPQRPDLGAFPGVNYLSSFTCHIKKGDILFVPAWMWHEVENVTDGWGCSYRFTSLRGFLKHPTFVTIRLFFTRPSFFEIFYYSFFRSDISKRDKNLLTPKIYLKK